MQEAKRITQEELGELLKRHLLGSPLEALVLNHRYVTDPDGKYVALETIDSLSGVFRQTISIVEMPGLSGSLALRKYREESVQKIRGAIAALLQYASPPATDLSE